MLQRARGEEIGIRKVVLETMHTIATEVLCVLVEWRRKAKKEKKNETKKWCSTLLIIILDISPLPCLALILTFFFFFMKKKSTYKKEAKNFMVEHFNLKCNHFGASSRALSHSRFSFFVSQPERVFFMLLSKIQREISISFSFYGWWMNGKWFFVFHLFLTLARLTPCEI